MLRRAQRAMFSRRSEVFLRPLTTPHNLRSMPYGLYSRLLPDSNCRETHKPFTAEDTKVHKGTPTEEREKDEQEADKAPRLKTCTVVLRFIFSSILVFPL